MGQIDLGRIAGKSAYEVAVDQGYTGTVDEWLESLKGEAGADGNSVKISKLDNRSDGEWGYSNNVSAVYAITEKGLIFLRDIRIQFYREYDPDTGIANEVPSYLSFGFSSDVAPVKQTVYVKYSADGKTWTEKEGGIEYKGNYVTISAGTPISTNSAITYIISFYD